MIWFDLVAPKQVMFFEPIIKKVYYEIKREVDIKILVDEILRD